VYTPQARARKRSSQPANARGCFKGDDGTPEITHPSGNSRIAAAFYDHLSRAAVVEAPLNRRRSSRFFLPFFPFLFFLLSLFFFSLLVPPSADKSRISHPRFRRRFKASLGQNQPAVFYYRKYRDLRSRVSLPLPLPTLSSTLLEAINNISVGDRAGPGAFPQLLRLS